MLLTTYLSEKTMGNVNAKALESGNVLVAVKAAYRESGDKEKLLTLLSVLRDSVVIVPASVAVQKQDEELFINSKPGDEVVTSSDIHIQPDTVKAADGTVYLPIFSQKEQMPEDYASAFSTVRISVPQAIDMARAFSEAKGLVLDPFTEAVVIPFELADIILSLPSQLDE